ncbi:response regulator transcription factor [Zoogloea sp. LCSB751]|uniref:response regulator transcription factor n=1 Tax=Zoogloea sp. LCSB751 TaxID=1965277 RepID=UPI0009A4EEBB|nr:response regulator [Zoogloea sp. LCSB751]
MSSPLAHPPALPTVYVVDDDDGVRESLRWLLESVGHPVRVFRHGRDFLDGYDPNLPGCLLLDIRMPLMGGFELQEVLRIDNPALPILFLTGHGTIPMSVRAMRAGAFDFIEKPFSDQALLERVQDAVNDAAERHRQQRHVRSINHHLAMLSPREREVLDLLMDGMSSRQIGEELGISKKTVEVHRCHIREKLGIGTVAELVRMVLNNGGEGSAAGARR